MNTQVGFPKELLLQPLSNRIAYFRDYTIAHPKLIEADQKLMHAIHELGGPALIFVFGPTGVGKSVVFFSKGWGKSSERLITGLL